MGDGDRASRRHRPRVTILVKLTVAFTLPTLALFSAFAIVANIVAESDLEAELGRRLSAIAASAATQLRGKYLVDLQPEDDQPDAEGHLFYDGARRKIAQVADATGVARVFVLDRDFTSRADTDDQIAIREKYFQSELDRSELERVFQHGELASGLLFQGKDGRYYKTGYAPLRADPDPQSPIVLAVGVDAPATFFERIDALRRSLILYGVLLLAATMAVAVVVALRITRPVRELAAAAERIGRGDLAEPVARTSSDEIGFLADTMDQMRQDLRERDERMQMMLAGVAHEVRNPLGGMELFAGILRDEIPADDERRRHVERIDTEIGHLKRVVNDFLEYARRPTLELSAVDLGKLAEDVCELEEGAAESAQVKLVCDAEPVTCRADGPQLRRALLNLVRNAIEASSGLAAAEVRVRVRADARRARVSIFNSGATIPAEVRARVFDPFFTTREKGTGLGLAFVREIIADHEGRIAVESDHDGTTFEVELPV